MFILFVPIFLIIVGIFRQVLLVFFQSHLILFDFLQVLVLEGFLLSIRKCIPLRTRSFGHISDLVTCWQRLDNGCAVLCKVDAISTTSRLLGCIGVLLFLTFFCLPPFGAQSCCSFC